MARRPATLDDLLRRHDRLTEYYKEFNAKNKRTWDAYDVNSDYAQLIPRADDSPVTLSATATAIVDEATDHVVTDNMRVFYELRGEGPQAQKRRESVIRMLSGMWRYWENHSDLSPMRSFVKNLFLFGNGIFKVMPDWDVWPEMDIPDGTSAKEQEELIKEIRSRREENFPIVLRALSPRHVMVDPTTGRHREVFETYRKSIMEVDAFYEKWTRNRRKIGNVDDDDPYRQVGVIEWWREGEGRDKETGELVGGMWRAVLADKVWALEPVFLPNYPNPYVIKYSGFGTEAYEGKPEQKAVGILDRLSSLLQAKDRRLNQIDAIIESMAWPTLLLPEGIDVERIKMGPGWANVVPAEYIEYVRNLLPELPSTSVIQESGVLDQALQRGSFSPVVRGERVPGATSAAQIAILAGQARLRFGSVINATEQAIADVNTKVLRYGKDVFKDDLTIYYVGDKDMGKHSLRPADVTTYHNLVRLESTSREEKGQQQMMAMQLLRSNMVDPITALELAGFDEPQEILERRDAYQLLEEPLIKRARAKQILTRWGIDVEQLEFEEAMAQAEQNQRVQQESQQGQEGEQGAGFGMEQFGPMGRPRTEGGPEALGKAMRDMNEMVPAGPIRGQ